jgi:hypothetical protein
MQQYDERKSKHSESALQPSETGQNIWMISSALMSFFQQPTNSGNEGSCGRSLASRGLALVAAFAPASDKSLPVRVDGPTHTLYTAPPVLAKLILRSHMKLEAESVIPVFGVSFQ